MNFLNFAPFHQPYNHYSLDNSIGFAGTYTTGFNSSAGKHCPLDKNLYPMDNSIGFLVLINWIMIYSRYPTLQPLNPGPP